MIQEVIVLKIRKERLGDFRVIRRNLQEKVETAEGFISSGIDQSIDDETVFLDVTKWETEAAMRRFNEKFRELNYGAELEKCVDGRPVYMGCLSIE